MSIKKRISNLWAWSGIEPANSYADVFSPAYRPVPQRKEQAKIISSQDPADELIETIREEGARQA